MTKGIFGIRTARFAALLAVALTAGTAHAAAPGDLDPSFDVDGWTLTTIGGVVLGEGTASAVQSDGKIVVAGYSFGDSDFLVARYNENGSLDESFGGVGWVTTAIGTSGDYGSCVAIQADGKIVVGGLSYIASSDFAAVRYNSDGTLDTSFSGDGKVTIDIGIGTTDEASSIAIDSSGGIVLAGAAGNKVALVRYLWDGTLDASFDGDGIVTTAIPGGASFARAVAIQSSDGKIVAAGYSTNGDRDIALVRYNTDGSLDTNFDVDGVVTTDVAGIAKDDEAYGIAIQSNGKIVVAGYMATASFDYNFALVRYNTNGSLDTSFNTTGKVATDLGASDWAYALAIQSNGKIVAAGKSSAAFALARYNTNGSLDTGFDGDGKVVTDVSVGDDGATSVAIAADGRILAAGIATNGSDDVFAVARYNSNGSLDAFLDGRTYDNAAATAVQADGKIVVAGTSYPPDSSTSDFAVMRYNTDGSLDPTFGTDGRVTTPVGVGNQAAAYGVAIQTDGKIVVAGTAWNGSDFDFAAVRYNSNGTVDTSFSGDGKPITPIGASHDVATAVAIQSDGKIVLVGTSETGTFPHDFAVVRYLANGNLDTAFSGDGKRTMNINNDDYAYAVAIQPTDGKIVIVGSSGPSGAENMSLVRLTAGGGTDATFNNVNGLFQTSFGAGTDSANAVTVQSDGKIVVAGTTWNGSDYDFAVARYDSSGVLDPSFSGDGMVTTAAGVANAVRMQSDGKIVIAGFALNGSGYDFKLVRYKTDGGVDTTFSGDGVVQSDFAGGDESVYALALQRDGKLVVAGASDSAGAFAVARYYVTNCGDGNLETGEQCDDGNNADGDGCDAGCSVETDCPLIPLPTASCLTAPKTQLKLKRSFDPSKNQLSWQWGSGAGFDQSALGAPDVDTRYTLCVYDSTGGVASLKTFLEVAPGSLWKSKDPKGWTYSDKTRASDGVKQLQLKTGTTGKTKAQLKSSGANLPTPAPLSGTEYFDQSPKVSVQLLSSAGLCLTSEFTGANTKKNDALQFQAKTP